MKSNKHIKISVLAVALLMSMSMFAQKGNGECRNNEAKKCEAKIPDLSEEQETAINKLRVEHKAKMTTFRVDLDIMKAELQKLEIASEPDTKAINSKIDDMFALKAEAAKNRSMHRQAVRSLLSDEQKVFFDAHRGKGRGHGHGRKGNNRG